MSHWNDWPDNADYDASRETHCAPGCWVLMFVAVLAALWLILHIVKAR